MKFQFLKYHKFYYFFSFLLMILSLLSLSFFRLNLGIDFRGGSILEIGFEKRPTNEEIQEKLKPLNLGEIIIQPTGEKGAILRLKEVDEVSHQTILKNLKDLSPLEELRFESIGPVIGRELKEKTLLLIFLSLTFLLIYISLSFRRVPRPFSSSQYGFVSLFSLFFDILVPLGILSLLGKFLNVQINLSIVTALLTVLGYTINDKIVVFDRIRENIFKFRKEKIEDLVNLSLNEVLIRSLSTGLSVLFVLLAIFFLGGESLKYFSLTLIFGILVGTYSSLFLAVPLLVSWSKWKKISSTHF